MVHSKKRDGVPAASAKRDRSRREERRRSPGRAGLGTRASRVGGMCGLASASVTDMPRAAEAIFPGRRGAFAVRAGHVRGIYVCPCSPLKNVARADATSRPRNAPGDGLRATGRKCCAIRGGGCLATPAATRPPAARMLRGRNVAREKPAEDRKLPSQHPAGRTQEANQKMLRENAGSARHRGHKA